MKFSGVTGFRKLAEDNEYQAPVHRLGVSLNRGDSSMGEWKLIFGFINRVDKVIDSISK